MAVVWWVCRLHVSTPAPLLALRKGASGIRLSIRRGNGFHYELGFGTGASFVRSTVGDLLDFDAPDGDPAPTSSGFAVLDLKPDTLDWSGGSVPSVSTLLQALAIDVPDNLSTFNPSGQNRFTLRQSPTTSSTAIPEPATLALLGLALAGLGFSRRRKLH